MVKQLEKFVYLSLSEMLVELLFVFLLVKMVNILEYLIDMIM